METSTIFEIISYMTGKGLKIYPSPVPGSEQVKNPACFICIDVRGKRPRFFEVDGKPVRYRQTVKTDKKKMNKQDEDLYVQAFNHLAKRK